MSLVGGSLGYHLLRFIGKREGNAHCSGSVYDGRSKLEMVLGVRIWDELAGKRVIDFGCGAGGSAIEVAQHGAASVIGIDNRESMLAVARQAADAASVADRCRFTTTTDVRADVILSLDAFEHFADPAGVLAAMRRMLKPEGCVLAAFGPPWYHPFGGHLFSVFPWAHLIFSEQSLIRWRADFKFDGATQFSEVAGGLNQMTVANFEKLVAASPLDFADLEVVPIKKVQRFAKLLPREFFAAMVRCRMVPRHPV